MINDKLAANFRKIYMKKGKTMSLTHSIFSPCLRPV